MRCLQGCSQSLPPPPLGAMGLLVDFFRGFLLRYYADRRNGFEARHGWCRAVFHLAVAVVLVSSIATIQFCVDYNGAIAELRIENLVDDAVAAFPADASLLVSNNRVHVRAHIQLCVGACMFAHAVWWRRFAQTGKPRPAGGAIPRLDAVVDARVRR